MTRGLEGRCSIHLSYGRRQIGAAGFEPTTSCAQGRRATGLRYAPPGAGQDKAKTCFYQPRTTAQHRRRSIASVLRARWARARVRG